MARNVFKTAAMLVGIAMAGRNSASPRVTSSGGAKEDTNAAPRVTLAFPDSSPYPAAKLTYIRLNADVTESAAPVVQVAFFADSDLLGVTTEPPYSLVWRTPAQPSASPITITNTLTAVATDAFGNSAVSQPVEVRVDQVVQPRSLMRWASPSPSAVIPVGGSFEFGAELLISTAPFTDTPVDFYIGTNQVRHFAGEPYSVVVTGLAEADYRLSVRFNGPYGAFCDCPRPINIRVAPVGIGDVAINSSGLLEFDGFNMVTNSLSYVEGSLDLRAWVVVSTNGPPVGRFHFTSAQPNTSGERFYRVRVAPQQ